MDVCNHNLYAASIINRTHSFMAWGCGDMMVSCEGKDVGEQLSRA